MDAVYGTTRFVNGQRPLKDYGKGRRCARDGCATILSRYNPLGVCVLCQKKAPPAKPPDCNRVPIWRAREALLSLRNIIGRKRIAEMTGVSIDALERIAQAKQKLINVDTEQRILAVANIGRPK